MDKDTLYLFFFCFCTGKRCSVEIQRKLEAVEIYNDLKRYREERKLITEMKKILNFYHKSVIPEISEEIKGIINSILAVHIHYLENFLLYYACTCIITVAVYHMDTAFTSCCS